LVTEIKLTNTLDLIPSAEEREKRREKKKKRKQSLGWLSDLLWPGKGGRGEEAVMLWQVLSLGCKSLHTSTRVTQGALFL
jgi:hypothetical protein